MISKLKNNKYIIILILIYGYSFYTNFDYAMVIPINELDIGAVFFSNNLFTMFIFIIITERMQHMIKMLKYRLGKNELIFKDMIFLELKYTIKYFILIQVIYLFYCILINKEMLITLWLFSISSMYFGIIILRAILSYIISPRITSLILFMILCLNLGINNLFPNLLIFQINIWLNIFNMNDEYANLFKIGCIIITFLLVYFGYKYHWFNKVKLLLSKINIFIILSIINLILLSLSLVNRYQFNINILFYNADNYYSVFDYILGNYLFYFILIYSITSYLYTINNGIYNYFKYRIKLKEKLKIVIIKKTNLNLIFNICLIIVTNVIIMISGKYDANIIQLIMDIVKLVLCMTIINYLALLLNNTIDQKIIVMNIIYSILIMLLTIFNIYLLIGLLIIEIIMLLLKKEVIS
ncbi:MAG: hypothetical protein LBR40_06235 [Bacilli bacterium]|jgi:hypothetical protein|nr:hypothetical protein [Bacilli bacterium]